MVEYYKNLDLSDIVYTNEFGMKCTEIWRDVPDFDGLYEWSDLGRIKSLPKRVRRKAGSFIVTKPKILKQKTGREYVSVNLYAEEKPYTLEIHRIMAIAYYPNPENKPEVNHKNGIKRDNRLVNLEWNTRSENAKHMHDNGLIEKKTGENNHFSKLTEKEVLEIRALNGVMTYSELAVKYNTSWPNISSIMNRQSWKHI